MHKTYAWEDCVYDCGSQVYEKKKKKNCHRGHVNFDFFELHAGFKADALLMPPAQEQFQTLHIWKDGWNKMNLLKSKTIFSQDVL